MQIEEYFRAQKEFIDSFPLVHLSNITFDKRGTHVGFIRGRLQFIDGSILEWREYLDVELTEDRIMYVYQYMDSSKTIIFRYDNTGHRKRLGLHTYPDHKHQGAEDNILPSLRQDLTMVLREIEGLIKLP